MHDTDFTFDWVTDSTIRTGDGQDTTKDVHPTFDWFTSSKISPGKLGKHQNLHYTLRLNEDDN